MKKKEEFQKLIETVLNKYTQSEDSKGKSYINTEEILHLFKNLNEQIDEQIEINSRLSKQIEGLENNLKLLIRELVKLGYIKIGERRNLLKRNVNTLEALINLLKKKNMISRRELLHEIKKIKETGQPQSTTSS